MRQLTILFLFLSLQACAQMTITPVMQGFTPSLVLDFTRGTLPAGLTFSRNSIATRVNAQGNIETVANDQPRFDYDPVTLQPRGILIEEARTNLATQSSNFELSYNPNNATRQIAATQAPNGVVEADVISTTSSSVVNFRYNAGSGPVSGTTLAFSMYLKLITGSDANISVYCGNNNSTGGEVVTLSFASTGVIAVTSGTNATVKPAGNGWYRLEKVVTLTAQAAALGFTVGNIDTGVSIAFWGKQIEAGSFATSYIPTTTSSVTRAADVCSIAKGGWYNPLESTWYGEAIAGSFYNDPVLVGSGSQVHNNPLAIKASGRASMYDGATDLNSAGPILATVGNLTRLASSWGAGVATIVQGGSSNSGSRNDPLSAATSIRVGTCSGTHHINGTIRRVVYYPRRLPNTYLQSLTQ